MCAKQAQDVADLLVLPWLELDWNFVTMNVLNE
jgi:hypothetical protein